MAALAGGQRDPKVLAQTARARMRAKIPALEEAFVGYFTDHHEFLLTKMLARIDVLSADIVDLGTQIEAQLAPFADAVTRLDDIPGVGPKPASQAQAHLGRADDLGDERPLHAQRGADAVHRRSDLLGELHAAGSCSDVRARRRDLSCAEAGQLRHLDGDSPAHRQGRPLPCRRLRTAAARE